MPGKILANHYTFINTSCNGSQLGTEYSSSCSVWLTQLIANHQSAHYNFCSPGSQGSSMQHFEPPSQAVYCLLSWTAAQSTVVGSLNYPGTKVTPTYTLQLSRHYYDIDLGCFSLCT